MGGAMAGPFPYGELLLGTGVRKLEAVACLEDEAALLLDGAARCCEQVASDGAVDACAQCGAGGFGREVLPAAREPEACGRIDETEDGDGSDDFIVRHGRTVRKRRAGNRDEEVERNRGDLEAAQPAGEVDAVRHGLAHAEESARAEFESGAAGGLKLARHAEDVSAAADAHVEDRLDLPQVFVKRAAERGKLGVSRICGVAQRFGLHGLFTSHRSVVSPEVVRQANADTHPSL